MNDWRSLKVFDGSGPVTCARHPFYIAWTHMFYRCYHDGRKRPGYAGCSVDPRFHNFSEFAKWAIEQVGSSSPGFEIDKDILIPGNRVYGPETCAFVPMEINCALIRSSKPKEKSNGLPIGVRKLPRKILRQFTAEVSCNGKGVHLGYFDTAEQAFSAYKVAKEKIIKELAMKYKSMIDLRVYDALMNYAVESPSIRALNKTGAA